MSSKERSNRVVELLKERRDRAGWNEFVRGWSIGPASAKPCIELEDDALAGCDLAVYRASNHVLLWGRVPDAERLPDVERADRALQADHLRVRFDWGPLRIGSHTIQLFASLDEVESVRGRTTQ